MILSQTLHDLNKNLAVPYSGYSASLYFLIVRSKTEDMVSVAFQFISLHKTELYLNNCPYWKEHKSYESGLDKIWLK